MDEKTGITLTKEEFLKSGPDVAKDILANAKKYEPSRKILSNDTNRGITISADISKQEREGDLSAYYDQALTQLISLVGQHNSEGNIIMQRGFQGHIAKINNQIILTQTWTDPTFLVLSEGTNYTVPGTITGRFFFDPDSGFELQTVEFSNDSLFQLIKNPPTPSPKNFSGLIRAAIQADIQENPGIRSLTSKKLLSLYPPPLGRERNLVDETAHTEIRQASKIPSIISAIVKTNSPNVELIESNKNPVKRNLFRDANGKSICRVTLTNPEFKIDKSPSNFQLSGTVTIDYTYEANKGYVLTQIRADHAALYRFILNTPHNPTETELEIIKNSAMEEESKLIFSKKNILDILKAGTPIAQQTVEGIFEDIKKQTPPGKKGKTQLGRDELGFMKVNLPAEQAKEVGGVDEYFRQEMMSLPNYIMCLNCESKLILNADPSNGRGEIFKNDRGETICRIEVSNPTFFLREHPDNAKHIIPGKIILEYTFETGKGFELRSIEFNTKTLRNLVLNPPQSPDPDNLKIFAQEAAKEEALRNQENQQPVARSSTPRSGPEKG